MNVRKSFRYSMLMGFRFRSHLVGEHVATYIIWFGIPNQVADRLTDSVSECNETCITGRR